MLLKTPKLGLEKRKGGKENIFSWIICLPPPVLWKIKEHLPVPSSGEKCQRSACPLRCALKSGRIGRWYSPHSSQRPAFAHLWTAQRPASLQPSVLTHYRSSWQHHKWKNSVHYIPLVVMFCTRKSVTCNNTWRVWIDNVELLPQIGSAQDKSMPEQSFKWKNSCKGKTREF